MSRANVENLTERERACLEHLRQAQEPGLKWLSALISGAVS
jgi:hypothetical protein